MRLFDKAGLKLVIMDADTFALESMFDANYEIDERDCIFLINIGASITNINVIKKDGSIFSRDVPLGGNTITDAIAQRHAVDFEEAERIKCEASIDNLIDFAEPVLMEIERSVDYFRSAFGGEYIRQVLLSGGSARLPGIAAALTHRLNIETDIANPFRNITFDGKNIDTAWLNTTAPAFSVGVGLALRRLGDR